MEPPAKGVGSSANSGNCSSSSPGHFGGQEGRRLCRLGTAVAWLTEAERNSASIQPSLGPGVGDSPGPSAVPAGQQEAIPAGLRYGAAELSACFRHVCECHFIGPAVSAVEEFVTNIRKTLPGSCAAVWGLQPERGTHGGPQAVPMSRGMEASSLQGYLREQAARGEQRGLQSPARTRTLSNQMLSADRG